MTAECTALAGDLTARLDRLLAFMTALANNRPGHSCMSSCSSCMKQRLQQLLRASMAYLQMQLNLLSCGFHVICIDHFWELALHSASQCPDRQLKQTAGHEAGIHVWPEV